MLYFLILLDIFPQKIYFWNEPTALFFFIAVCAKCMRFADVWRKQPVLSAHCKEQQGDPSTCPLFVVLTECLQIQGLLFIFMKSQHSHRMRLHVKGTYMAFILSLSCLLPTCSWWVTALVPLIHTWKLKSKVVGDCLLWIEGNLSASPFADTCSSSRWKCNIFTNIVIWMFCGSTILVASDIKTSNLYPQSLWWERAERMILYPYYNVL